jgi:sugar/nucleoside kinase (ribokinase family)
MKFLVIGNLTKDTIRIKDQEKITFGGSASYCSITAKRLGWDSHILSRGNSKLNDWIKFLESEGITIDIQESKNITHNLNVYDGEDRKEWSLSDAGKINHTGIKKADIIHIGPVFNEITIDCVKEARKKSKILSLDVQGFLRKPKNKQMIKKFWKEKNQFLKYIDILKISKDEIPHVSKNKNYYEALDELLDLGAKIVILTLGENGALIAGKEKHRIPAFKTNTIDPTGCGDVFSAAFVIKYFETKDLMESGFFASAAASYVVEDFGTKNIVDKSKVDERFKILKTTHNLLFGE